MQGSNKGCYPHSFFTKDFQLKPVTIYALAHPKSPDVIRYIGKTEKPLRRRLTEHIAERNRNLPRCHRRNWVKSLFEQGLKPIIWPIEQCSTNNWIDREKHWIAFFKPLGTLTNGTDGGEGGTGNKGWKWSPDALKKISKIRKGKVSKAQLESLEKGRRTNSIRASLRPKKKAMLPEERRQKRAEWARLYLKWPEGKLRPRRTLESRQRMSQKMMGRKITWNTNPSASHAILMPIFKACNEKRKKPVVAIETGQEFASISDAIRGLGCTESGFREALKRGWKCRGVHWKFKESEKTI